MEAKIDHLRDMYKLISQKDRVSSDLVPSNTAYLSITTLTLQKD